MEKTFNCKNLIKNFKSWNVKGRLRRLRVAYPVKAELSNKRNKKINKVNYTTRAILKINFKKLN